MQLYSVDTDRLHTVVFGSNRQLGTSQHGPELHAPGQLRLHVHVETPGVHVSRVVQVSEIDQLLFHLKPSQADELPEQFWNSCLTPTLIPQFVPQGQPY